MNIRNVTPLILFVIVSFITSAQAQIPRTLSYQGMITDASGTAISNGPHTVKITIYDAPTGGSTLYSESIPITTNTGLFNLIIGADATPIPTSLTFSASYWIGIAVDGAVELTPRTSFTAVPYSLAADHAANADVANGLSATAKGFVSSINEQSGPIRIEGRGAANVTTNNGTITVAVPQGGSISQIQNADSTIVVTDGNGPTVKLSVGKRSISSERLGFNSVANYHIQNKSVTAAKIDAGSAAPNYCMISDGSGNVYWGFPTLQIPYAGIVATLNPVFAIINNNVAGTGIRGVIGGGSGQAIAGAAIWGDAGTNLNGIVGTSNGGSGVLGLGSNGTTGVSGVSASGDAISGISTTGRAGFFQIANNTSTANGIEISNAGTGTAVYGKSINTVATGAGVVGESASPSGTGVKASYIGTGIGTPLTLDNGAIKVTGTNKAAFVHTITAANRLTTTSTEIDNPICNGDPNCFLSVTYLIKDYAAFSTGAYKQALGVYYDAVRAKWQILSINNQVFPIPAYFNVWVVKQ